MTTNGKVYAVFESMNTDIAMVGVFTTPERAIAFARTRHESMVQAVDVDSTTWDFESDALWTYDAA